MAEFRYNTHIYRMLCFAEEKRKERKKNLKTNNLLFSLNTPSFVVWQFCDTASLLFNIVLLET
jgi:hypothetical protein